MILVRFVCFVFVDVLYMYYAIIGYQSPYFRRIGRWVVASSVKLSTVVCRTSSSATVTSNDDQSGAAVVCHADQGDIDDGDDDDGRTTPSSRCFVTSPERFCLWRASSPVCSQRTAFSSSLLWSSSLWSSSPPRMHVWFWNRELFLSKGLLHTRVCLRVIDMLR